MASLTTTGSANEPILICVQCQQKYKESQNIKGRCKYHPCDFERIEARFYRDDDMYACCALSFNTSYDI